MKRILMIYENKIPTVEISENTFLKFSDKYKCSFKCKCCFAVKKEDINNADIVIGIRAECALMRTLLHYAKKSGRKTIILLDDDLMNLPAEVIRFPERKKWLMKCLSECEIIISSSRLIADEYKKYIISERAVLLDTVVDKNEIFHKNKKNNKIRIVYSASNSHIEFYNKYIKDIIPRLVDKYGDLLEFFFVGVNPEVNDNNYKKQMHIIPYMPFDEYNLYMKEEYFDIGLAPLSANHFTARKYFNKFIEYTKNGICGVYSKCMPYILVVKDGINGFLVENDTNSWFEKLCSIIESPQKRSSCINNAQQYLLDAHSQGVIFKKLIEDIPELINYDAVHQIKCVNLFFPLLGYKMFRVKEILYLTVRSFKQLGIQYTIKKIKIKLSRRRK